MQSVLKHVQLKPSSLNSAELLNDLLKWVLSNLSTINPANTIQITAFYLQINDDANSGPIKLNLDIRDGSIVVCVPGRFKNLGSIENGILDPQMWRLHTMTVSNSPPSLRTPPNQSTAAVN